MSEKIKVVWLCHFYDKSFFQDIQSGISPFERRLRLLFKKDISNISEFGVWNVNAINEIKRHQDIQLIVICPNSYITKAIHSFSKEGVQFYFYKDEGYSFFRKIINRIKIKSYPTAYTKNRRRISQIIQYVNPDIVHVIGAENPSYSLGLLEIPNGIPSILQLQTLMADPVFEKNLGKDIQYGYRRSVEIKLINTATFIGTAEQSFKRIISEMINPDAVFLNLHLATGANSCFTDITEKKYDFVYFASDISKAADLALESFVIAHRGNPNISLNIVGGYDEEFKHKLDIIIEKNALSNRVVFSGRLPSHEDVINQIRLSKVALLPLRVDFVSSTIREAMANGLPVITTITEGTPTLNRVKNTVMLSAIGDVQSMAENMKLIIEDNSLFSTLRDNGFDYVNENLNNTRIIEKWVNAYKEIVKHKTDLSQISKAIQL